jgi:hypothetical protein
MCGALGHVRFGPKADIAPRYPWLISAGTLNLMSLWKMFLRERFHFGFGFCLFECHDPEIEKMRPATAIGAFKSAAEEKFDQH